MKRKGFTMRLTMLGTGHALATKCYNACFALQEGATAEHLGVENLVLYHTEDDDLPHRKERYVAEGRSVYGGNLHVPDDLETLEL